MMTTGDKVVPIISSLTVGPLGVPQLPRLWTKLTLAAAGRLPEGYSECGQGFDQMVLTNLHLNRDEVVQYVRENKPTYVEFEQWVLDKNNGRIDPQDVANIDRSIREYRHRDELSQSIRTSCGITDAGVKDGATLNLLEDLNDLHAQTTGKQAARQ